MNSNSADIRISRRFTRLYILALSAVALSSIAGQLLIQHEIANQRSDSRVINLAGRQRFQSQQIVKTILILTERKNDPAHQRGYRQDLTKVLATWDSYHRQLQTGHLKALGVSVSNSAKIAQLFGQLEPHFLIIQKHAHQILNWLEAASADDPQRMEASVQEVLNHELVFLRKMDEIVFQYDKEAQQKLDSLRRSELTLLGLTLFVLALEGTLVFRPAVRELKRVIIQLIDSELRTQQANTELMQANQSLKKAEAELLALTRKQHQQEINEQKLRAAYVIEGQEEERRRQAREIHDGLGQMLTALKLSIEKISGLGGVSAQAQLAITHLQGLINQTIAEVRTISFNLMPAVLSDFGVASALKLLAEQNSKNSNADIVFHSDWNEARLDKNVEIGLYRIAQEGVNNAIKYAQASEITLKLSANNGNIHLHILDNGQGFRRSKLEKASLSNGINNMKLRSHLLNGHFRMVASPGKGTRIYVKVPLKHR